MEKSGYGIALDTMLSDIRENKLVMSRHELIGRYLGKFPLEIIKWAIDTLFVNQDEFGLERMSFNGDFFEASDFIGVFDSPRWPLIVGSESPWCEVEHENHD